MKKIALTQGKFAIVDDSDFGFLNQWKWYALPDKTRTYYAARTILRPVKITVRMHRVILGLKPGDVRKADHKNGNGLDNRRGNLRVCDDYENQHNRWKQAKMATSKYKGVCVVSYRGYRYFNTRIQVNNKRIFLGSFPYTPEGELSAARVYNSAAKKHHGAFAQLNIL